MAGDHPAPLLHLPLMEFTAIVNPMSAQALPNSLCAKIERRLSGCLEAYGFGPKGKEKCKDLVYDFHECQQYTFQMMRYKAIRKQRMKLYREGKIDKPFDEHPPIDGLIFYQSP